MLPLALSHHGQTRRSTRYASTNRKRTENPTVKLHEEDGQRKLNTHSDGQHMKTNQTLGITVTNKLTFIGFDDHMVDERIIYLQYTNS